MADPTTEEITLGVFAPASVDRLRFAVLKDGVAWTGIDSVSLVFEKPDRETQFTRTATLETPDAGVWYYDTQVTDFPDEAASYGWWTVNVRVTDGTIVKRYPYAVSLEVREHP